MLKNCCRHGVPVLLEDGGRKVGQGKKKRVRGWGW
jgi:hypothetical protein